MQGNTAAPVSTETPASCNTALATQIQAYKQPRSLTQLTPFLTAHDDQRVWTGTLGQQHVLPAFSFSRSIHSNVQITQDLATYKTSTLVEPNFRQPFQVHCCWDAHN